MFVSSFVIRCVKVIILSHAVNRIGLIALVLLQIFVECQDRGWDRVDGGVAVAFVNLVVEFVAFEQALILSETNHVLSAPALPAKLKQPLVVVVQDDGGQEMWADRVSLNVVGDARWRTSYACVDAYVRARVDWEWSPGGADDGDDDIPF